MAEIIVGAIIGVAIYTALGLLMNALQSRFEPTGMTDDEYEFLREW